MKDQRKSGKTGKHLLLNFNMRPAKSGYSVQLMLIHNRVTKYGLKLRDYLGQ